MWESVLSFTKALFGYILAVIDQTFGWDMKLKSLRPCWALISVGKHIITCLAHFAAFGKQASCQELFS